MGASCFDIKKNKNNKNTKIKTFEHYNLPNEDVNYEKIKIQIKKLIKSQKVKK